MLSENLDLFFLATSNFLILLDSWYLGSKGIAHLVHGRRWKCIGRKPKHKWLTLENKSTYNVCIETGKAADRLWKSVIFSDHSLLFNSFAWCLSSLKVGYGLEIDSIFTQIQWTVGLSGVIPPLSSSINRIIPFTNPQSFMGEN